MGRQGAPKTARLLPGEFRSARGGEKGAIRVLRPSSSFASLSPRLEDYRIARTQLVPVHTSRAGTAVDSPFLKTFVLWRLCPVLGDRLATECGTGFQHSGIGFLIFLGGRKTDRLGLNKRTIKRSNINKMAALLGWNGRP
jgi:hypothetical protein